MIYFLIKIWFYIKEQFQEGTVCSLPSYGWFNSHIQTDACDCRNTYFHNSVSACPAWDLCEILPRLKIVHHKWVWTTKKLIVNLVWTVVNINKDLLTEILAYVWWGLLRISVHTLTAYQTAYSAWLESEICFQFFLFFSPMLIQ